MTGRQPLTYDHLRSRKKPTLRSVRIAYDSEEGEAFEEARQRREFTQMMLGNQSEQTEETRKAVAEAEEAYRQAKATVEKNSAKFTFRSVGRRRYDALVGEHPRTDMQKKSDEDKGINPLEAVPWNEETFPQALISVSMVEPTLTSEQVADMWDSDDWSGGELVALFECAFEANTMKRVLELGKD